MALKTCKNGHRYDDSITPECPECAALARHTLPLGGFDDGMWGEPDDYGKTQPKDFGGGSGAGVKIDPVAFLVIKDGVTRVMPVTVPPISTVDRVIDLVPEVMDRVDHFIYKRKEEKESF